MAFFLKKQEILCLNLYFEFQGLRPDERKCYEQQENTENPLRCPVKLYEFYLSKWWVKNNKINPNLNPFSVPILFGN